MAQKTLAELLEKVKDIPVKEHASAIHKKGNTSIWEVTHTNSVAGSIFTLFHFDTCIMQVLTESDVDELNGIRLFKPSKGWSLTDKRGIKEFLNLLGVKEVPTFDGPTARYGKEEWA